MKVVILAGGYGTRLSEETRVLPKPMIEIGGMPILWHIMKYYYAYGHDEFIICLGYKGDIIKEWFYHYWLRTSDVTMKTTAQGTELQMRRSAAENWSVTLADTGQDVQTGLRIKRIEEYVGGEPFFLTYGDGLSNVDLNALLAQHNRSGNFVTITAEIR